tara:strand:+ start:1192 stop:1794 length:603 start_codon:yes stop_codon:yes gene_type:complete
MSRILVDQVRSNSASSDALTLDGSGNITVPGNITLSGNATLSGTATGFPGGLNASYARLADVKGTTTQGGSFTSGAWRTRDISTIETDPDSIVSLSNHQFTLQAGTYHIFASCCAVGVDNHNCRIYNITDSSTLLTGLANKNQEENVSDYAHVRGQFTISGTKVFELQHRCQTTVTTHGFGAYASWNNNVYSTIEIHKRS